MATLTHHGGSCCGMKHIYNFRDGDAQDTLSLKEQTFGENLAYANGRYQLEVILSDRQTRNLPNMLAELARLGYVYTSSWTGQHGTPVHLFHRAKQRLALSSAHFYNLWVNELNGMVLSPDLAGALPDVPQALGTVRQAYGQYAVGSRVRINSPTSRFNNQEATIVRNTFNDYGSPACVLDNGATIIRNNLIPIPQAAPPPPPVQQEPIYRHPQQGGAAPQQRRLVLSQFYCVFAASGLPSRVFATLAEGQEAYPRARNWQERKVYSDGEIVEGPMQHG